MNQRIPSRVIFPHCVKILLLRIFSEKGENWKRTRKGNALAAYPTSSDQQKACMRTCCKIRALWSGLDCSKSNSQGSICPPIATMPEVDAILSRDIHVRS
jgi:hypothetical protein